MRRQRESERDHVTPTYVSQAMQWRQTYQPGDFHVPGKLLHLPAQYGPTKARVAYIVDGNVAIHSILLYIPPIRPGDRVSRF